MRNNFYKSKTSVLSSNKIKNYIWSINLTSAQQRERTVKQEMKIKNFVKSDFILCCRSIWKNKHWNVKDWNIHKFTACSSEYAAE